MTTVAPARHSAGPDTMASPPKSPRRRPRRGVPRTGELVLRYGLMLVAVLSVLGPLLWQVSTSLKGPGESTTSFPAGFIPQHPTLANYQAALSDIPLAHYLLNSTLIALMSIIGNVVLATLTGYALGRMRFRGRNIYFLILLATAALPFEVILVSTLLVTRQVHLQNTFLGVVLPHAVSVMSIFVMRQAFMVLPGELEEAAVIDGANQFRVFTQIMLPSVWGSIAVVATLAFIQGWDQFIWPLVILSSQDKYPVTVGLQFLSGTFSADQRVIAAGTVLVLLPPLVVFFIMQKKMFRGLAEGALKG